MKKNPCVALLLSAVLAGGLLAGCGGAGQNASPSCKETVNRLAAGAETCYNTNAAARRAKNGGPHSYTDTEGISPARRCRT